MSNGHGRCTTRPSQPQDTDGSVAGYRELIAAILARAVADATGRCGPTRGVSGDQLQQEARDWLHDEAAVAWLIELGGYDARPVLRRLRPLLERGR
jgi:hypothetical protein